MWGTGLSDLTRRGVLAGLLAGAAGGAWAEAPLASLRPQPRGVIGGDGGAAALVAAAKLGGRLGYCVADAATGRVLEASGETAVMPPASVTKGMTALYALERLGSGQRFVTRVMYRGRLDAGRLQGDLILAGGGDPELDTDSLADLVAALAATGLREVTGQFIVYTGALPERAAIAHDQPDYVGYNPSVSGIMLNFNRVNFVWKQAGAGYDMAMNAEGARFVPPVRMATMALADRDLPVFAYKAGSAADHWTVARGALGKAGERWLPVRHPGIYAGEVFAWLAAGQGIALGPPQLRRDLPPEAALLVARDGAPLPDVLRKMLKFSTNLTAEAVGLAASAAPSQEASAAAMTAWARDRFGITGRFGDHSGLGPNTQLSAADMVSVLSQALQDPKGAQLQRLLRDAGLPDAAGKPQNKSLLRVQAKSGTMNFVSNLAGYVTAADGKTLVFAIFAADVARREAVPVAQRDQPKGNKAWVGRAHRLQGQLLHRWAGLYL